MRLLHADLPLRLCLAFAATQGCYCYYNRRYCFQVFSRQLSVISKSLLPHAFCLSPPFPPGVVPGGFFKETVSTMLLHWSKQLCVIRGERDRRLTR